MVSSGAAWRRFAGRRQAPYDQLMVLGAAMFALGIFVWTFIEYAIHGFLSHIFTTFATPLHDAHHRDAHAVFTVGGWIPAAIMSAIIFGVFGLTPATILWLGIVTGFVGYELLHYRIHFSQPLCALEERLRRRHLVHHLRVPDQIFGVTNRIWDRAFGTEPDAFRMAELQDSVAQVKPLTGPSNFRLIFRPWFFLSR